jgi:hypothetical protein
MCVMLFQAGSLYYAVQEGARCAAVQTATCSDGTSTVSYTKSLYYGPSPLPTFTYAAKACGNSVTGSIDYAFDLGLTRLSMPISATACFP